MILSRKNQHVLWGLIIVSITILGQYIRSSKVPILFPVNVLFLVALFVWVYFYRNQIHGKLFGLYAILLVHTIVICMINDADSNELMRGILYMYAPTIMLMVSVDQDEIDYRYLCTKILKYYNVFIVSIFVIYFLDYPLNGLPMKIITNIATGIRGWLPESFTPFTYRYASYVGHYIYTSECYTIFFILNMAYAIKTKQFLMNKTWVYLIAIVGVLSTGSKVGIVAISVLVIYTAFTGRRRIISIALLLTGFVILNYAGAFDLVLSRFTESADITTGRNEAFLHITTNGQYNIHWLKGLGFDFTEKMTEAIGLYWTTVAREYPFLSYLYMYGILNTFLYLVYIFGLPFLEFFKNKNFNLCCYLIVLLVEIGTYNAILSGPDAMILYVLVIMFFKYLSNIDLMCGE